MEMVRTEYSHSANDITIIMHALDPGIGWKDLANHVEWKKLRNSTFCIIIFVWSSKTSQLIYGAGNEDSMFFTGAESG